MPRDIPVGSTEKRRNVPKKDLGLGVRNVLTESFVFAFDFAVARAGVAGLAGWAGGVAGLARLGLGCGLGWAGLDWTQAGTSLLRKRWRGRGEAVGAQPPRLRGRG